MERPVVLITGASRGLGAALAREWARRDAGLILTARNLQPLSALAKELSRETDVLAGAIDVTDDFHMREFIGNAAVTFGRIDVLVNNASVLGGSPMPRLEDLTQSAFFEVMDVNVRAPLAIAQRVIPHMRAQSSGIIVNVTSDAAVNAYPGWGAYGTSKAALEHLSRILNAELEGSGIRTLILDPGNMDTQMHRDAEPGEDLSGMAKPEDVAPTFVDIVERARLAGEDTPIASKVAERYEVQSVGAGV
jgi:NAD(P)-dependent dehydrogenase (short-subunit alcohol dehydrogenase family)